MCKVIFSKGLLLVLVFINTAALYSQNLSGNITTVFAAVQATGANSATVNTATGFAAGDRVLLIQMQGAGINNTNTASFGDVTTYNNCGNYEFLTIASVAANTINFTGNLTKSYTTGGKVQLVKVAVHGCPVISATVTCIPWNGTTGGIIALETPGTLTMNAGMDAVGSGFRGQPFCIGGFGCSTYNWYLDNGSCEGAKKGEGIAPFITAQDGGKGKQANGGGGGDPSNSGAGGGGNFGAGGQGGDSYSGCGSGLNNNGRGGAALDYSTEKAYLGGAGGTGFNDNSQTVTSGGTGGGLIFINAQDIAGNGNSINAAGQTVPIIANDESAGGGGGGGGVFLRVDNFQGLTVNVSGGNGGSTYNNIFTTDCHAPGGGGGGGVAWFKSALLPAGVTVIKNGGLPGTVQNPQSSCYNTTFGAQGGTAGAEKFNLSPVTLVTVAPVTFSLGNDTAVCTGQQVVLNAGSGFTSYLWQDGSTNSTFTVTTPGTYYCAVTAGCGTGRDTVVVNYVSAPSFTLGNDTAICNGQTVQLSVNGPFNSYTWQDGSTAQTYTVTNAGTYYCAASGTCGTARDTIIVNTVSTPSFSLGNDTAICAGQTVQLSVNGPFNSYTWQDGSTAQTYTVTTAGTYYCTASGTCGTARDTIVVSALSGPSFWLGNDTVVCPGQPVQLIVNGPFNAYLWQNGATTQSITATSAGTYYCAATGNCGTAADTLVITDNLATPVFNLGNDTIICPGNTITLVANNGFNNYLWQNGSTANTFTTTAAGTFYCTAFSNCGNASDTVVVSTFTLPAPFNLGADTLLCTGNQLVLTAGNGYNTYTWQNGSAAQNFTVTGAGLYYCMATHTCGQVADSIVIAFADMPVVNLGPDAVLCQGDELTLTAACNGCTYLWQDNSTASTFVANKAGTFTVVAGNSCGNATDAVQVEMENCDCKIFVPNAFSPNGDGANDVFLAGYKCTVVYFRLMLFNRWGEKVFEALNPNEGWDGTWKGVPQPAGVYTYALSYTGDEGREAKNYKSAGTLTLIR